MFREWIHCDKESLEVKLRLVRTLTSEDEKEKEMLETARAHVGAVLVSYALGNPPSQDRQTIRFESRKVYRRVQRTPERSFVTDFRGIISSGSHRSSFFGQVDKDPQTKHHPTMAQRYDQEVCTTSRRFCEIPLASVQRLRRNWR